MKHNILKVEKVDTIRVYVHGWIQWIDNNYRE